jgi:hypothetical protein
MAILALTSHVYVQFSWSGVVSVQHYYHYNMANNLVEPDLKYLLLANKG